MQQKQNKPSEEKPKAEFTAQDRLIAAVRVRGLARVTGEIVDTLQMLNLHKKNYCSVYIDTPSIRGMLMKGKDYITYGEIDFATYQELLTKKGEQDVRKGCLKKFFRLSPPRKGFGRKGIKVPFANSGALGYRKDNKMKDLLVRML